MTEETEKTVEPGKVEDMTPDYIAAIKELKEKSVDRSKYDELRAENKKLLDAVVNGQVIETQVVQDKPDIQALRNNLAKDGITNLEYVETALKLRKAVMENGEADPFLKKSHDYVPTQEDISTAERVAAVLQDCVDYADGDSMIFTNELQRRMIDVRR